MSYLGTSWHEDNEKRSHFWRLRRLLIAGKGTGYLLIIPGVIHQRQPFIQWPTLTISSSLTHIFQSENVRAQ